MTSLTDLKTPGVYVEEINAFPPSIAQVPTAIPAFVGYTEKAERNGESLNMKPTKIASLLEYSNYFGGGYALTNGDVTITVEGPANNYAIKSVDFSKIFYLYEAVRHFYDNGGGECYIVSAGNYADADPTKPGDETADPPTGLRGGLKQIESLDEPTLLVFPDAVLLSDNGLYSLQQMALMQCAKLQDRFSIFDLKENTAASWDTAVSDFRDQIGVNDLNYSAAYTPWVYSAYGKTVHYDLFQNKVTDASNNPVTLNNISADPSVNQLVINLENAGKDQKIIQNSINGLLTGTAKTILDQYNNLKNDVVISKEADSKNKFKSLMNFVNKVALAPVSWPAALISDKLKKDLDTAAKDANTGWNKFVTALIATEKNNHGVKNAPLSYAPGATDFSKYDGSGWLSGNSGSIDGSATDYKQGGTVAHDTALRAIKDVDAIITGLNNFINKMNQSAATYDSMAETIVFASHPVIGNIANRLQKEMSKVPSSGAVAGCYARVDGERGVWKAPANVSLNSVTGPTVLIDDQKQESLNIDVNSGKSINAIRSFSGGRGTLIWGARTLDGNSNDWRYVPVRRLFIMVEESVKKACASFVFEPNDGNTWVKVRAMIENYLTNLWRAGALVGTKPDQAFYVRVGLGVTMTQDDILNGRMIVEIGMAPAHPAEFIVLRFTQKMQEA